MFSRNTQYLKSVINVRARSKYPSKMRGLGMYLSELAHDDDSYVPKHIESILERRQRKAGSCNSGAGSSQTSSGQGARGAPRGQAGHSGR